MHITFSPVRRDDRPTITRTGDVLTIDGQAFDFAPLTEGATLPAEAIGSDWISGPVRREAGVLHLTLMLSHGADAPQETLYPAPVELVSDGPVPMPPFTAEEPSA